jgi:hypothetical protein
MKETEHILIRLLCNQSAWGNHLLLTPYSSELTQSSSSLDMKSEIRAYIQLHMLSSSPEMNMRCFALTKMNTEFMHVKRCRISVLSAEICR